MKPNIKIFTAILAVAMTFTSCEGWFDVRLDDQANLPEIFSKRNTTHNYLACGIYDQNIGSL